MVTDADGFVPLQDRLTHIFDDAGGSDTLVDLLAEFDFESSRELAEVLTHALAAEARAEKLVEALEGWADWHRKACIDSDDDLTYINGDGWADADKLAEQSRAALSEYAGERR